MNNQQIILVELMYLNNMLALQTAMLNRIAFASDAIEHGTYEEFYLAHEKITKGLLDFRVGQVGQKA